MEHERQQSKEMIEAFQVPSRDSTPTPPLAIPVTSTEQNVDSENTTVLVNIINSSEKTSSDEVALSAETEEVSEASPPQPEKGKRVLFSAVSESEESDDEEDSEEDSEEEEEEEEEEENHNDEAAYKASINPLSISAEMRRASLKISNDEMTTLELKRSPSAPLTAAAISPPSQDLLDEQRTSAAKRFRRLSKSRIITDITSQTDAASVISRGQPSPSVKRALSSRFSFSHQSTVYSAGRSSTEHRGVEDLYEVEFNGIPGKSMLHRPDRQYPTNYIRTTKYTIWSFVPVNLFFQVSDYSYFVIYYN
jgi:hypothetical protein